MCGVQIGATHYFFELLEARYLTREINTILFPFISEMWLMMLFVGEGDALKA